MCIRDSLHGNVYKPDYILGQYLSGVFQYILSLLKENYPSCFVIFYSQFKKYNYELGF